MRHVPDAREQYQPFNKATKDGRNSALTHTIQGIEDFELIAFIVVQEVKR